ncbi:MAG: hypothetical protein Q8L60_04010 [Gammaproteobacteria bacterium]|nr:hypothetical protein [Gammaproteobacteria bacterium]MDP2139955.1 hypothetical protein [Gammaproteobacteria bacterium]MDP2347775.1 hypothetical protein [Gammaproteobacteria bacterium]
MTTMINSPGPLASKAEWAAHLTSLETLAEVGQDVADLIMVAKAAISPAEINDESFFDEIDKILN